MKIDGIGISNNYSMQTNGLGQGSREDKSKVSSVANQPTVLKEKQLTEEQIIKAVEKANKSFEPFDRKFEISVHEKTNTVMVKVIDATNDELIREIPAEKILDMIAHMLEVAGLLVDKKV